MKSRDYVDHQPLNRKSLAPPVQFVRPPSPPDGARLVIAGYGGINAEDETACFEERSAQPRKISEGRCRPVQWSYGTENDAQLASGPPTGS